MEESIRLLDVPEPKINGQSDDRFYGYFCRPTDGFPTKIAPCVQWIYVFDLDNDTFSVGIPFYIRRIFHLQHIPRSLFDPQTSPDGEISEMQQYRVLLDPVPRAHLAGLSVPVEPDRALVDLYHSSSPVIQPLPSIPDVATFPVRKYLRLYLGRIFSDSHRRVLRWIYDGKQTRGYFTGPLPEPTGLLGLRFRQMVYGMVNLASSGVEVEFKIDRRYKSTIEWEYFKDKHQEKPPQWPVPDAEYWIGDILIIPEMAMSTAENLHSAIGKAVQIVNARYPKPAIPSDATPRLVRALIISASCLAVVDICGSQVTHTPNMPLDTRYHPLTSGACVLHDILYKPEPRPPPTSVPILPVEICQKIYHFTDQYAKPNLGMSCRLFRGIAYDYGPLISEWYLQGVRKRGAGYIFIAVADRGAHVTGGKVRQMPRRRALVYVNEQFTDFRPIHRVVLRKPEGECIELQMPLLGVMVGEYIRGD